MASASVGREAADAENGRALMRLRAAIARVDFEAVAREARDAYVAAVPAYAALDATVRDGPLLAVLRNSADRVYEFLSAGVSADDDGGKTGDLILARHLALGIAPGDAIRAMSVSGAVFVAALLREVPPPERSEALVLITASASRHRLPVGPVVARVIDRRLTLERLVSCAPDTASSYAGALRDAARAAGIDPDDESLVPAVIVVSGGPSRHEAVASGLRGCGLAAIAHTDHVAALLPAGGSPSVPRSAIVVTGTARSAAGLAGQLTDAAAIARLARRSGRCGLLRATDHLDDLVAADPWWSAALHERVIVPLRARQSARGVDLVRTLVVFVESGFDRRATAELLHIQGSSLRDRLGVIRELTGLDVRRPIEAARLTLAVSAEALIAGPSAAERAPAAARAWLSAPPVTLRGQSWPVAGAASALARSFDVDRFVETFLAELCFQMPAYRELEDTLLRGPVARDARWWAELSIAAGVEERAPTADELAPMRDVVVGQSIWEGVTPEGVATALALAIGACTRECARLGEHGAALISPRPIAALAALNARLVEVTADRETTAALDEEQLARRVLTIAERGLPLVGAVDALEGLGFDADDLRCPFVTCSVGSEPGRDAGLARRLRENGVLAAVGIEAVTGVCRDGELLAGCGDEGVAVVGHAGTADTWTRQFEELSPLAAAAVRIGIGGVVGVDDLLPLQIVLAFPRLAVAARRRWLDPLTTPKGARTDLLATMTALVDHDFDRVAAARALGVHPNTLRYRLTQIARRTGLELDNPRERLLALVALTQARLHPD